MPTKRKHERELFSSRKKGKAMRESPVDDRENSGTLNTRKKSYLRSYLGDPQTIGLTAVARR